MALFLAVRIFEQCLWYNKYSATLSKSNLVICQAKKRGDFEKKS